jgi:ABC-2 type transport system permease protein
VNGSFAGTATLLRLALRRDRVLLPATVAVFVLVVTTSSLATTDLYPTQGGRTVAARAVNETPALVALYGPVYDVSSRGALSFFKLIVFGAALVALFAVLLVVRHTRAEEEVGLSELVAAGAVGRDAPLTAGVLLSSAASLLVGLCSAIAVLGTGFDAGDAAAFGAAWCGAGLVFTGVAAVAAQLTPSARTARGIAVAVLGAAYLARAVGDSAHAAALVWASPLGWCQQIRPFAGNRWGPVLLLVLTAALLTLVAAAVRHHRDLGAGVLPERPGPAGGELVSTLGLAWRLHRSATMAWALAVTLTGFVLGNLVTHLGGFLNNPSVRALLVKLGGTRMVTDAFLSTDFGLLAIAVTGYGLSVLSRMRAEEQSGRLEPLLATGTSRLRWASSHVLVAMVGSTAILATTGLATGLGHAQRSQQGADVWRDTSALLARAPALWCVVAATCLLFGLAGRCAPYGWALLVASLVLGELGDLMGLPLWARRLSPYAHVPPLPGAPFDAMPLVVLAIVAAALAAAAGVAFSRRDVAVG